MTGFLRRWGPALLWTALLFFASSQPTLPVELRHGTDKLAHFAAYTVLGFFLARGQWQAGMSVLFPIFLGSLTGALDEIYQSTVPGRVPSVGDWVADTLGVVAGVSIFHAWMRSRRPEPAGAPLNPSDSHD